MFLRIAAAAALLLAPLVLRAQAATAAPLSLDDAFARVVATHPDLRAFGPRGDVLAADGALAALAPPLRATVELEDIAGSGGSRGVDGAELTLSLASVIERGGKRAARRAVADARVDALAREREAARLDLLAEVARRHLAVVAAMRGGEIAALDAAQRRRAVEAARQRFNSGASPESALLAAQAALAQAELDGARAEAQATAARRHLAALWGDADAGFVVAASDPLRLPEIADGDALAALLAATPDLQRFASEARVREARLRLADTDASADVDWSLGVRRSQAGGDSGLVASLSVPLGSAARARPAMRAARAELVSLGIERESHAVALASTLAEAHGRYTVAKLEVDRMATDVLPRYARAEAAAGRAYRAGASSYLEWAQLQAQSTEARRRQLDAALSAQAALVELQRLTGASLVEPGDDTTTTTPAMPAHLPPGATP